MMGASVARSSAMVGVAVLAVTSVGCAHVNREELGVELAQIRQEMSDGDRQVSEQANGRIDGLEARVDGVESRVDLLEQDLSALETRFNVAIERLEAALRVHTPIYFGFDQAAIRVGDEELLDNFSAIVLTHFPEALITVEGFADPAGSASYNLTLGRQRAEAVRQYLINNGTLAANRVRAVSYGEDTSRLVTPGKIREEGWANRRVVMVIDHGSMGQQGVVAARRNEGS